MPIEVGKFTTEVTVADGDLPLSPTQLEKLIQLVIRRVEERQTDQARSRDVSSLRNSATPPDRSG